VRLEVFQWRVEIVVNVKAPFGHAKASNSVGRCDPNETSDGHIAVREHNLLARMEALQQLRDRTSLFNFERAHFGSIAACESASEPSRMRRKILKTRKVGVVVTAGLCPELGGRGPSRSCLSGPIEWVQPLPSRTAIGSYALGGPQ